MNRHRYSPLILFCLVSAVVMITTTAKSQDSPPQRLSLQDAVRLAMKKNRSIAAVAMARKLAVRLWWMWKLGLDTGQKIESGSHAG